MTQIAYTPSVITSWLDSGYRLLASQFSYSIPGAASIWPGYGVGEEPDLSGFALPDAGLAAAFVSGIEAWDGLISPDFKEVPDNQFVRGTIRLAVTDVDEDLAGYAYFPGYFGEKPSDIWLGAADQPTDWDVGSYGYVTLLHELGHAVGLDHSFVLDSAPESLDSLRYTVMSYNWIEERYISFTVEDGAFYANFAQPVPETPMVLDIAAVQRFYGIDLGTNSGATTYRFEPMSPTLRTITDANGIDTFDLSDISYDNVINLRPGSYSSIGMASVEEQISYWSAKFPDFAPFVTEIFTEYLPENELTAFTFTDNIGIALSSTIENATGGSGRDEIYGNAVSNILIGNAGDDVLAGLDGRDRLEGGDGNDHLYGNGVFVMPSRLATKPGEHVTPAPIEPVEPEPLDPSSGTTGGTSSDAPSKPESSAPQETLPDRIAFVAANEADSEIGTVRTTDEPSETTAPQPPAAKDSGTDPGSEPVDPPLPEPGPNFDDTLFGGAGDDLLMGGSERDFHWGGTGADLFRFADEDFAGATIDLADVISDFSEADGDRIDLSAIDAVVGIGDDAFKFIGTDAFSGVAGELRIEVFEEYLMLFGETTGDAIADFAIRLDSLTTLSVGAIIV